MKSRLITSVAAVAIALAGMFTAQAQVDVSAGVARISLIHGDVSTQRGDSGDWAAAALNAPIVSGDKVSTGTSSRAEVQLDWSNILRLSNNSQATIAGLTRTEIQVQVGQGIINYDVFKTSEANVEIDTPNAAVHPGTRDGSYRIAILPNGDTEVIVRKGEANVATPQGSTLVQKGQMITVRGNGSDTEYRLAEAPNKDEWDRWNSDRDNTIRNAASWRNTNDYYVGSEDLDSYGRWSNVPDYGQVWVPAVAPGWAPYRAGRWVWEPYYGWTWVSYEPWGWAPYHYGRWFMYGGSWAWWPGPVRGGYGYGYGRPYRPVWAPAYVSFFGFGGGVGVSVGFGSVGWLPIGPCDRYYPWWGGYRNHYNVVNITNVTNVYNYHGGGSFGGIAPLRPGNGYSNVRLAATNERMRQAISTVPAHGFGTGMARPSPVTREAFTGGRMMTGNLPVVPTRQSLTASGRPAAADTVRGGAQRFYGNARPVATRQSFDHEASQVQQSIQNNGRFNPVRAGGMEAMNRPQALAGNNDSRTPAESRNNVPRPGTSSQNNQGRGMTAERPNANQPAAQAPRPQSNEGWRRFGGSADQAVNRPEQANSGARNQGSSNPGNANQTRPNQTRPNQASPANDNMNRSVPRPQNSQPQSQRNTGEDQSWRHFSNSSSGPEQNNRNVPRPAAPQNFGGESRGSSMNNNNNDSWRRMSPQSETAAPRSQSGGNDAWRHTGAPQRSEAARPSGNSGSSAGSYSRPPLNMRQPVVNGSRGGYNEGRSAGENRGSYGGGGRVSGGGGSSPRMSGGGGGARPSGGGGGGGHAAPAHSGGGRPR